jgi:non-specific protein-tyrosine kinase
MTDLSILGHIPNTKRITAFEETHKGTLQGEAIRRLGHNILTRLADRMPCTLMVTSVRPGDGKSTIAAHLARYLSTAGKKVILVDTDDRRPTLHSLFGLPNEVGLTSFLSGEVPMTKAWQKTDISKLTVLTSGPQAYQLSDGLLSEQFDVLLERLKKHFDVILLDTPAFLAVADAVVIAPKADGVLLVTCYGQTSQSAVADTLRLLDNVKANVEGIVVNRVGLSDSYYSYYRHYRPSPDAHRKLGPDAAGKVDAPKRERTIPESKIGQPEAAEE